MGQAINFSHHITAAVVVAALLIAGVIAIRRFGWLKDNGRNDDNDMNV